MYFIWILRIKRAEERKLDMLSVILGLSKQIYVAPRIDDKIIFRTGRDVILQQVVSSIGIIRDHPNDFRSGWRVFQEPRSISIGTW